MKTLFENTEKPLTIPQNIKKMHRTPTEHWFLQQSQLVFLDCADFSITSLNVCKTESKGEDCKCSIRT